MHENLKEKLIPILKNIGVTRMADITGYEDEIVHVFQSIRPNGKHLIVDSGKGEDKISAFVSCAVESIERYVAENHTDEGMDIEYNILPEILQDNYDKTISLKKIKAVKGYNLIDQSSAWIPKDLVDYRNKTSESIRLKKFFSGTTGLGAHTNKDLAIFSGLIEILERDAIANQKQPYILNLKSVPNDLYGYLEWIEENVGKVEIKFHVSDYNVFVFSCTCRDNELVGGFNSMGACVDKHSALKKCIMEGIQTWLMRISASRDDWCFAKRGMNMQSLNNNQVIFYQDIGDQNETSPIQERKHKLAKSMKSIFVYEYNVNIDIDPIKVVRVIIPHTKKLEQGEMFTGIPRGAIL